MLATVATATGRRPHHRAMDGALKRERDDRIRTLLESLKTEQYKSTAALARALGVEPPTITEVLNGKRGVGLDLMIAIATLTGRSLDDLAGVPRRRDKLADLPAWTKARAEAERRLAHLRPEVATAALDKVAGFGLPETPVALTGLFVARLAEAVAEKTQEF